MAQSLQPLQLSSIYGVFNLMAPQCDIIIGPLIYIICNMCLVPKTCGIRGGGGGGGGSLFIW